MGDLLQGILNKYLETTFVDTTQSLQTLRIGLWAGFSK